MRWLNVQTARMTMTMTQSGPIRLTSDSCPWTIVWKIGSTPDDTWKKSGKPS
jgi:hypothetical protein